MWGGDNANSVIVCASNSKAIYKSTNGGASWTTLPSIPAQTADYYWRVVDVATVGSRNYAYVLLVTNPYDVAKIFTMLDGDSGWQDISGQFAFAPSTDIYENNNSNVASIYCGNCSYD